MLEPSTSPEIPLPLALPLPEGHDADPPEAEPLAEPEAEPNASVVSEVSDPDASEPDAADPEAAGPDGGTEADRARGKARRREPPPELPGLLHPATPAQSELRQLGHRGSEELHGPPARPACLRPRQGRRGL